MNERIKQLALEARLIVAEPNGFDPTTLSLAQQKFAYLLSKECADFARRWTDAYVVEDTAPRQIDAMMDKHFGVDNE